MPTLCFGCELWIIKHKDIHLLQGFQRYSARGLQRLHPRSLKSTSRICLGWIDIILYIMAKKALFIRTIFVMKDYIPIKSVLVQRIVNMREAIIPNTYDSPIIDIINATISLGLFPKVQQMANGTITSKEAWKKLYGPGLGL